MCFGMFPWMFMSTCNQTHEHNHEESSERLHEESSRRGRAVEILKESMQEEK